MNNENNTGSFLEPKINFDPVSGKITISGNSIPVNVDQLFNDVILWLEEYAKSPHDQTSLELNLKYMNGKSVRSLIDLFKVLQKMSESGENVKVEWNVPKNAEDMKDLSEHIFTTIELPHDIRLN